MIKDIIQKYEDCCQSARNADADGNQYIVTRLEEMEELVSLAKRGLIFTEMIETWAEKIKKEKESNDVEQV